MADDSPALREGEFVGGCDIIREMFQGRRLQGFILPEKGVSVRRRRHDFGLFRSGGNAIANFLQEWPRGAYRAARQPESTAHEQDISA